MADLIYVTNVSLDVCIEDRQGAFDFTEPSDEVFAFITDLVRPLGTHLYGRRLYESMAVWETDPAFAAESELMADFAGVWQEADKVVYSTTLDAPSTERTRIERSFDPDAVRAMKESTPRDLMIGGAEIAGAAFDAGLVDACHLFVSPVVLGGGTPAFASHARVELELVDEHRFASGTLHLHHRVRH